ncbi:hypothetical protein ACIOHE_26505 [Streptomyces sp. NPDC087851]|uniref:hypothetical protein n=1 Tax=Streptomyces sp. NPDC087851 TaxID=3365810 RepID=UPI00382070D2
MPSRSLGTLDRTRRIHAWLASSLKEPEFAKEDWKRTGIAVLRCGVRFDVIRMHPDVVHAAIGTTSYAAIPAAVEAARLGPVIADHATHYYALVPVGTVERWSDPHGEPRGIGAWVGVPRLDLRGPDGVYWASPLEKPGSVCEPEAVAEFLDLGCTRLGGVA